jgi:hypothetical protein
MGKQMNSFQDIIDANGGPNKFYRLAGIPQTTAHTWYNRNRIPANHWYSLMVNPLLKMPSAKKLIQIAGDAKNETLDK